MQGIKYDKEEVMKALQQYFLLGYSRRKACMFVGVNSTTLSKWESKDPTLSAKIDGWKNSVNARARQVIAKKINDRKNPDSELSKWWLERREKKSFSTRTEQDVTSGGEKIGMIGILKEINDGEGRMPRIKEKASG